MKVSEIFDERPKRWGLRGCPYFWDYLKDLADGAGIVSPNDLETWIKKEYFSLSGEEMTADSVVFIEQFAHGGMSSGHISGEWWLEEAIPLLKSRLQNRAAAVPAISFRRRSVCMGDDVNAGEYTINMPEDATLGALMRTVLRGGCGNTWPIPYTGANSYWIIKSNIGNLAEIYTDSAGEWHIKYFERGETTPLKGLGIEWVFGDRN